jgi:photosystem II stability/assembly factor-like uncharacterized protein
MKFDSDVYSTQIGINDVQFISDNVGYMIGYIDSYESYAVIYKTLNGGINWSKILTIGSGTYAIGKSLHLFDENLGFFGVFNEMIGASLNDMENNVIYHSEVYNNDRPSCALFFIDYLHGIFQNARTLDGGDSWEQFNYGFDFIVKDYSFYSIKFGIAVSSNGIIAKTNDFGLTWDILFSNPDYSFNSVAILDTLTIIAGGNKMVKTNDKGKNWFDVFDTPYINDIRFINKNIGFAALSDYEVPGSGAWEYPSSSGRIIKTLDAGTTWNVNYTSEFIGFRSLSIVNENTIIAVGAQDNRNKEIEYSYILKTTTQGE